MATISDLIEAFLKELMETDNSIEIRRNELAKYFQCAPSQINYVLMTRFGLNQGFATESQRGGGGYIKITRLTFNSRQGVYHKMEKEIGEEITKDQAQRLIQFLLEQQWVNRREAAMMRAAIDDRAFPSYVKEKDRIRAGILKGMLATLLE